MGATITQPAVVDVKAGQGIVLTVDGKPVAYIHALRNYEGSHGTMNYEFVGMGVNERLPDGYSHAYHGSLATTLALEVDEHTVDAVVYQAAQRYGRN